MATRRVLYPASGAANGTSWSDTYGSIDAVGSPVGNDIILVDKTHAFVKNAGITWTLPSAGSGIVAVLCVDKDNADALSTGAMETTGGNYAFTIGCANNASAGFYIHGMTLKAGASGAAGNDAAADIYILLSLSGKATIESCNIWTNSTSALAVKQFGGVATTMMNDITFSNTVFRGQSTGAVITTLGRNTFYNCSVDEAGATPNVLFSPGGGGTTRCYGCDWHKCNYVVTQGISGAIDFLAANCVTPATLITGTHPGIAGGEYTFIAYGPATTPSVFSYYRTNGYGICAVDTTVYLTAEPSEATQGSGVPTSYSWKLTPYSPVGRFTPIYTPWIEIEITSAGTKTLTLKAADSEASPLNDVDIGIELRRMGGANVTDSAQSQYEVSAPLVSGLIARDPYVAGSPLTDTAEAWTNLAENNTYDLSKTVAIDYCGYAYVRAAIYKATTNPVYVDGKVRIV